MPESNPTSTDPVCVAVALLVDRQDRILLIFNEKWRGYAPPMTKLRRLGGRLEDATTAARRAAVEALGVSVETHGDNIVDREELTSARDHRRKNYVYEIVPLQPAQVHLKDLKIESKHAWLNLRQILTDEVTLTDSAKVIITKLVKFNALPFRCSRTSVLIVRQSQSKQTKYLLKKVRNWGFMFPVKQADPRETSIDTIRRVIQDELGLTIPKQIRFARSAVDALILGPRKSIKGGGWYLHHLFDAELKGTWVMREDMVWATRAEIEAGRIGLQEDRHAGAAISPTVQLILGAVRH